MKNFKNDLEKLCEKYGVEYYYMTLITRKDSTHEDKVTAYNFTNLESRHVRPTLSMLEAMFIALKVTISKLHKAYAELITNISMN